MALTMRVMVFTDAGLQLYLLEKQTPVALSLHASTAEHPCVAVGTLLAEAKALLLLLRTHAWHCQVGSVGISLRVALAGAGSCEIVRQVVRFFEENADESIVDSSKLYQGCSIETVRH